jgi:hypothetical protein
VVLGTTGWDEHLREMKELAASAGIGVLAAANFSLGMHVFALLVEQAARRFGALQGVGAWIHETHHAAKIDAPSGTALMLHRVMTDAGYARPVDMASSRVGYFPGTHEVGFDGPAETVTLMHSVRDRAVFAHGALEAAKWLNGRQGWFTMRDMINREFTGLGTALITPFTTGGALDEDATRRLAERQVQAGVHFVVPCGTTGEAPTLTDDEKRRVVEIVGDAVEGRAMVLAGAGGYDTREVIRAVAEMERAGAHGILSVTPYYNRPTQEGLFQHYRAIAGSTRLPILIYNVPGRTGCNVEPATLVRLAEIPNIVGVKEASGNMTSCCRAMTRSPCR